MSEIVNLGRARKARARTREKAKAAENRIRFGLTKAEKAREAAEAAKAHRDLDGAKRER